MLESIDATLGTQMLQACPTGILILDSAGQALACNKALVRLLGHDPVGGDEATLNTLLASDNPLCITGNDGESRYLEVHGVDMATAEGITQRVLFYTDVSGQISLARECARLTNELRAQSLKDPDTGVLNQRGLMVALEPQVSRSRRYNDPLSVVTMGVNSDHTDQKPLLVAVSRIVKDQVRWADLVGITENKEFILALPETCSDDAVKLAEKLSDHLHGLRDTNNQAIVVSYGVTEWHKGDNASGLLERAFNALNEAKTDTNSAVVAL